jgi:pseudo-response regulator 5
VQHIQEENLAERMEQKTGVTKDDNLNSDGPCKNRECSEQESDAQVSSKISEHYVVSFH